MTNRFDCVNCPFWSFEMELCLIDDYKDVPFDCPYFGCEGDYNDA